MSLAATGIPATLRVVAAIAGVAALFMPWLAGSRFGVIAVTGFAGATILVALMAWAGLAVAAGGATAAGRIDPPGAPAFVRATLGPPAARALAWYYIIGVSAGQAVVATVGGLLLLAAIGAGPGGWAVAAWAVLVLSGVAAMVPAVCAATGAAAVGPAVSVAVVLAAVAALARDGVPAPVAAVGVAQLPSAVFLVLFAFVGAESVLRMPRGRPALAAAVVVAGLGYLAATALIVARGAPVAAGHTSPLPVAWSGDDNAGRALAAVAGAACVVACIRNLAAVARLLTEASAAVGAGRGTVGGAHRWPPGLRTLTLGPAAVAGLGVALVAAERLRLVDVLAVPNAMALAIFLTISVGALVAGRGLVRAAAGLAVVGFAGLTPFAWPAVLSPAAVLLVHLVVHLRHEGLVHAPD